MGLSATNEGDAEEGGEEMDVTGDRRVEGFWTGRLAAVGAKAGPKVRASRARLSTIRDFTVPSGMPRTSAISPNLRPS